MDDEDEEVVVIDEEDEIAKKKETDSTSPKIIRNSSTSDIDSGAHSAGSKSEEGIVQNSHSSRKSIEKI